MYPLQEIRLLHTSTHENPVAAMVWLADIPICENTFGANQVRKSEIAMKRSIVGF